MSALIEDNNALINPEDEVRKLQDIVKKLERQNQILRSKQDNVNVNKSESESNQILNHISKISTGDISKCQVDKSDSPTTEVVNKVEDTSLNESSLDDVELLSLDSPVENDDSWLYPSPTKPTAVQDRVSPCEWARQEFVQTEDHGTPHACTLLGKLNQVSQDGARRHEASPQPVLSSSGSTTISASRLNTATFTRPKRQSSELPRRSLSPRLDQGQISKVTIGSSGQSSACGDHRGALPTELLEVHLLARMQEESLRQSLPPGRRYSDGLGSSSSGSSPTGSPYASQYLYQRPQVRVPTATGAVDRTRIRPPGQLRSRGGPSGLPRGARGGIPRISSASRLPSPANKLSGLRKPASSLSRFDDKWKDGCY